MRLMSIEGDLHEAGTLRRQYESVALGTISTLWRRKWLMVCMGICGLVLGLAGFLAVGKRYTAEGLIQLDPNLESGSQAAKGPPRTTIDGALIVEGEARIIRSRPFARRVVQYLQLDKDPQFQPGESLLLQVMAMVRLPTASMTPEPMSIVDQIATEIMKSLSVSNDIRSYLINVAFTSRSPEIAAKIANGYVEEYLRTKALQRLIDNEAAARAEIAELGVLYGDKHPRIARALANLAETKELRLKEQQRQATDGRFNYVGETLMQAPAVAIPSGPRLPMVMAFGLGAGVLAAIFLIMLLERRDGGFRTDQPVLLETGVRCVAMLPRVAGEQADKVTASRLTEAVRMLCLGAGLIGEKHLSSPGNGRVVMITSSVPNEGKSFLVSALAHFLTDEGHRVLTLDMSPRAGADPLPALERAMEDSPRLDPPLEEGGIGGHDKLDRSSGLKGGQRIFSSADFPGLIDKARGSYDFIIIEAPALLLLSDAVFLGRHADVVLHAAKWQSTPRRTVKAALQRLRDLSVRVDGVVLTEVDLRQHKEFLIEDQCHFFNKYKRFYEKVT